MSSERSTTKDAAAAFSTFLERLGRFFDIFDLSFFVSGATAVGAFAVLSHAIGVNMPDLPFWLQVSAVILSCYVTGLLCFAAGRWVRMGIRHRNAIDDFDARFEAVLHGHGLNEAAEVKEYLERANYRGIWRLYVRLWAEVRQAPELSESLALLNRYWVMAATFDGMTMALTSWILAVGAWALNGPGSARYLVGISTVVFLVALIFACAREAGRYVYYQLEEVVASIAALRAKRIA